MCIQNALQQHILDLTNDGEDIIAFFYAAMQGRTPNATTHHQMQAAIQLRKLGLDQAIADASVRHSRENGNPEGRGEETSPSSPPSMSVPATDLDIINYDIAHLIREETQDGYFIADFLSRVMRGTDYPDRSLSEADRIRAGLELLNRGLGRFGHSRSRRISDCQEELIHSGIARYIRERTDSGLDTARFLLEVASGQEQSFTLHQRVVAVRELIRRGWDTNYEAVTPEDIAAYRERQQALEPTEYDIRLQQWRENERATLPVGATGRSPEEEPQLEAGLFAHLSFAEIDRYEAMSAEKQAEFVERQRQLRATRLSAASQPDLVPVIPAKAGIHTPDTPDALNAAETEAADEPDENHETTGWNTLLQDTSAPTSTPHPTHPVHPVRSQPHIRSP